MTCPQDDKRMEGLRILARMIAAAYRRRTTEAKARVALPLIAPTGDATPASGPSPDNGRLAKGAGTRKRVKDNVNSRMRREP